MADKVATLAARIKTLEAELRKALANKDKVVNAETEKVRKIRAELDKIRSGTDG